MVLSLAWDVRPWIVSMKRDQSFPFVQEYYGVSNHRQLFVQELFRSSKKIKSFTLLSHCELNPLVTGGFLSQTVSKAEGVSITWRYQDHRKPCCLVTVYPKKYAHGFCFAVLCCGYTLTDFPISIRLTSLALWQSNDCPSASKATLMNIDKYFMWIHYERLHNHNKAKHNKTVCIFLGIYCSIRMAAYFVL